MESYGEKEDKALQAEVLRRNEKLVSATYNRFVNPVFVEEKNKEEETTAVKVMQLESFFLQLI